MSVVITPSSRLLLIQSLAHVAAAMAVLAATVPPWLATGFLMMIGASLAQLRRAMPVSGLVLNGDGLLEIVGADGTAREVVVHPHTFMLSFLVVLLYRQERRLRSLTLLADSLAEEDFRQLRLWLRWRSAAVNAG